MLAEPQCSLRRCKHFSGVKQPDGTELTEVVFCPAFPDGIPRDIVYGTDLHTEVRPGQVGAIVFEEGVNV